MNGKIPPNAAERAHMGRVKRMACICCTLLQARQQHPTDVHHIIVNDQPRNHWLTLPLCWSCHQGPKGVHGDKTFLRILKMTEWTLLGFVLAELMRGLPK